MARPSGKCSAKRSSRFREAVQSWEDYQAFTPLCVAKAEQEPEQLVLLQEESTWKHDDIVVEAGWVDNVNEKCRADVARACAVAVLEAMEEEPTATSAD